MILTNRSLGIGNKLVLQEHSIVPQEKVGPFVILNFEFKGTFE